MVHQVKVLAAKPDSLEFDLWTPHGRKREPNLADYPLLSRHVLQHTHVHMPHTCAQVD